MLAQGSTLLSLMLHVYMNTATEISNGNRYTPMSSYFEFKDCKNHDRTIPIVIAIFISSTCRTTIPLHWHVI